MPRAYPRRLQTGRVLTTLLAAALLTAWAGGEIEQNFRPAGSTGGSAGTGGTGGAGAAGKAGAAGSAGSAGAAGKGGAAGAAGQAGTGGFTDLRFSPHGTAFLTDAIIVHRYVKLAGRLLRALTVVKLRGSPHSDELRLFHVDDDGLHIDERLAGHTGLLTGRPLRLPAD